MAGKLQVERIDGELKASGLRFGIVVSRFNSFITDRLLAAAVDALERAGAVGENVNVVRVPGAFELPLAAKKLAATGRYDALIAIGCVLRGETTHYDYVCSETARGLQLAQMDSGLPIIFCVLTCDTLEQAIDRAGLKGGNKGFEAGLAAIEMARHEVVELIIVNSGETVGTIRIGPDPLREVGLDPEQFLLCRLGRLDVEDAPLDAVLNHGVEDLRGCAVEGIVQQLPGMPARGAPLGRAGSRPHEG